MGTDKSQLVYYEKPQYEHVHHTLVPLCEKVVISCNAGQAGTISGNYERVVDLPQFSGNGPIAAILSAFQTYPGHDLLVAGCDYPFLTIRELTFFLHSIKRDTLAAAFYNEADKYEPLLAWYSSDCAPILRINYENGDYALQYFLQKVGAEKYRPESKNVVTSIDTPEDFKKVRDLLARQNDHENGN
ncbi:molybdenum cofactor guanylyltransferase [Dyadobacter sp. CY323]|nr:molybdenum cofactor guanylyltransferase [Dyadobacter sp. CY323]